MAYLRPLIFYILAALAIFMLISPSHSSLDNVNDNVTVSLYYETSLCPRCASFISNDLVKVFHTDLHTITNLRLVPWSNAEIHCQHGEEECHLNTIHSCVIHFWPDVKEHLEFIGCTEQQSLKGWPVEALWKNCSEKLRLNEEIINECYTTGFGYKLLLQYANETAHLKPAQEYVPWVVVNNQPLRQDFENFVKYVCQAYKGDHKPAACKAQSSNLSPTIYACLLSTVNSQSQLISKYMEFGRKTLMTCRCPRTMEGSLAPIQHLFKAAIVDERCSSLEPIAHTLAELGINRVRHSVLDQGMGETWHMFRLCTTSSVILPIGHTT
ncbi:hypothetical protein E1A91_D10G281200v1 [Gossypium mustelinum]|uniref:Saposin A-type domain-containing protein n=1 Tax=Gossypium mustelinum TaxID=34275 RepID=A0A5D2TC48_GOSMU|nr:hypothetical protein E1A91_D10G281200v1 [Gossypium mustelinum]